MFPGQAYIKAIEELGAGRRVHLRGSKWPKQSEDRLVV